ncbi:MAG: hypothetical protein KatS3mg028_0666 [Bacteroidia bacterium]|nr:MAG: hypothetical protein KatS3mg028_0666 [Bacteroidia bacterium]
MTVQEALKQAAEELKKNPQEYINMLMQYSDRVLERKLDIIRQQKQMALDQNKKGSYELLSIKEDLIVHVRLIKHEQEMEEKPKKKNKKDHKQKKISKKQAEEIQDNNEDKTKNLSTENNSPQKKEDEHSNSKNNNKNNPPIQLTLDL